MKRRARSFGTPRSTSYFAAAFSAAFATSLSLLRCFTFAAIAALNSDSPASNPATIPSLLTHLALPLDTSDLDLQTDDVLLELGDVAGRSVGDLPGCFVVVAGRQLALSSQVMDLLREEVAGFRQVCVRKEGEAAVDLDRFVVPGSAMTKGEEDQCCTVRR